MSKSTISTFELFEMFPDAETAREYMEKRRWPGGHICPACGEKERLYDKGKGYHRCNACSLVFTVRTSTIFERSKIGLHKWLYAMYLFVTARKGISSVQLAKQIGVTQKSAWFMLQRLNSLLDAAIGKRLTYEKADRMTENVKQIIDAVTDKVLAYRPADKGQQAKKLKRKKKRDERKSSI